MTQDAGKDFFISYTGADRGWAEWIGWHLEKEGYSTVVQAWDFRPGCNFILEMQKAASEATRTIAIFSPKYLEALYTKPEWAAAFQQDPTGEHGTLLPIRVLECKPTELLAALVYIDLVSLDEAVARSTCLRVSRRNVSNQRLRLPILAVRPL